MASLPLRSRFLALVWLAMALWLAATSGCLCRPGGIVPRAPLAQTGRETSVPPGPIGGGFGTIGGPPPPAFHIDSLPKPNP